LRAKLLLITGFPSIKNLNIKNKKSTEISMPFALSILGGILNFGIKPWGNKALAILCPFRQRNRQLKFTFFALD
jgi:hypothetical protein